MSLFERLQQEVDRRLDVRSLHVPEPVSDALARTATGWIIAQEQPTAGLPGIPVPENMYDDVADALVQYLVNGRAQPPPLKLEFWSRVKFFVSTTLEQLNGAAGAPDVIDTLAFLTLGKWREGDLPYVLGVYAREFAGHYRRGFV